MLISSSHSFTSPKGFIVLEGINGAGKTTLQNRLADYLEKKNFQVVKTREPGGSPQLGKPVRALLLETQEHKISSLAELFLFSADRADHVEKVIQPALAQKKIVLCDRFFYSSIAFQGYGRGIDRTLIEHVSEIAVAKQFADLVLLLDLDPDVGLARSAGREKSAGSAAQQDNFEQEPAAFQKRIREGFLALAKERPEPFLVLNAAAGPDEIFNQAKVVIDKFLQAL